MVDKLDSVKIYVWMMSVLTFITALWLGYNCSLLSKHENQIYYDVRNFKKMVTLEEKLPKLNTNKKKAVLANEQAFFRRAVADLPELPEVEVHNPVKKMVRDVPFCEHSYTVSFVGGVLDRYNVVRYLHTIEKKKCFLKAKKITMKKAESVKTYEDRWVTNVVFAYRVF